MVNESYKIAATSVALVVNPAFAHCGKFELPLLGLSFLGNFLLTGPIAFAAIVFGGLCSAWSIIRTKELFSEETPVNVS